MRNISQTAQQLFKKWGRQGGKKRAKKLSMQERSNIALNAARARWKIQPSSFFTMQSIRLKEAKLNDPVYIEEILSDGTWEDWKTIYHIISDQPFGDISAVVEKVCISQKMYGISNLWMGIIRSFRGGLL